MGARDYMFDLLDDPDIMARVHEARDRFLDFRAFWAERYMAATDISQLDEYFDSFERRARQNRDRMCEDCIFTVANGGSLQNPYREARQKRQKDGYDLQGRRVQFAQDGIQDPGPNQLCLECENAWLDELQYGWELYCERRTKHIDWAPQTRPAPPAWGDCCRLPGGKYMWCRHAIPGYTKEEAWEISERLTDEIVTQETGKDFLTRLREAEKKYNKSYTRKETLRADIKIVMAAHIREDGKRLAAWEAGSEERSIQVRAEIRTQFIALTVDKYGEDVLSVIDPSDIARYCIDVEAGGDEDHLWYSTLKKYNFDQTTDSCLYFIKQGPATKIGITDSLDSRFAQIKTSAAFPCEIANVVYTHFGYEMEQELHQRLRRFNSHLEWFVLPPEIEKRIFKAKSLRDIEQFLEWFEENY